MPKPTVVVESVTPSFRIFHSNFEVTTGSGCQVSRGETATENGEPVPVILEEILKIPGIETVVARPYGIGVHKAYAFAWEPIHVRVLALIQWVGENLPVDLAEVDMDNLAASVVIAKEGPVAETAAV